MDRPVGGGGQYSIARPDELFHLRAASLERRQDGPGLARRPRRLCRRLPLAWCPILPAIGIALLAVFGLLYAFDYDLYLRILAWPIDGVFPYPFLDWIFVPAQIDCWRQGVDVYVATACDPLNRPMSYSPLWLRLTFIPTGKAAVAWTGLGLDVLFIAMLGFLPRPRRRLDFAIVALAVFSSATILALERANADLVLFAVAVFAGMCLERRLAARVIGYCAILLAGLLKFYPLVMLILLARERVARCIALGLAAVALLGGLAFAYRNELARMLPNVPHWNYFEPDIWGSMRLPGGSVTVLRAIGFPEAWVGEPGWAHPVCWIIGGALGLATVSVAVWLARSGSIRAALEALPVRHANFLGPGLRRDLRVLLRRPKHSLPRYHDTAHITWAARDGARPAVVARSHGIRHRRGMPVGRGLGAIPRASGRRDSRLLPPAHHLGT